MTTITPVINSRMMITKPNSAEGYRFISLKAFLSAFIVDLRFLLPAANFDPWIHQGIDKVQQEDSNR